MNTQPPELIEAANKAAGKPCQLCTKPALYVFDSDTGYVPVCNQHYQEIRAEIERMLNQPPTGRGVTPAARGE